MRVQTIDEAIAQLDSIVVSAFRSGDRRGYFAALYNRVTRRVRDGIRNGEFEDNPRMERFDVVFANYYFDNHDSYERGESTTVPWKRAFDACRRDGLLVIQHLLLGMNAHIVLDLGRAVAELAPGSSLPSMRGDYERINALLAEEVGTIEDELVEIAGNFQPDVGGLLRLMEMAAGGADRTSAAVMMAATRESAWRFATRLAHASGADRDAEIARQENEAVMIADAVMLDDPMVELLAGDGSPDVPGNIRVLARGEIAL